MNCYAFTQQVCRDCCIAPPMGPSPPWRVHVILSVMGYTQPPTPVSLCLPNCTLLQFNSRCSTSVTQHMCTDVVFNILDHKFFQSECSVLNTVPPDTNPTLGASRGCPPAPFGLSPLGAHTPGLVYIAAIRLECTLYILAPVSITPCAHPPQALQLYQWTFTWCYYRWLQAQLILG